MNPMLFYDHVLFEISSGKVQEGITMLAGMLDAVSAEPALFADARDALELHDLNAMLREDPLFAASPANPGSDSAVLRLITSQHLHADVSSTGSRLFAASSGLTLSRALRSRRACAAARLAKAWQQGRQILLLDSGILQGLDTLAGQDLSNITCAEAEPLNRAVLQENYGASLRLFAGEPEALLQDHHSFDFICAPEIADRRDAVQLGSLMQAMAAALSANGQILLAALEPSHFGAGWRRAYLDWQPYCHDAAAQLAMAKAAGLSIRSYHDETGCLLWSELAHAGGANVLGGTGS